MATVVTEPTESLRALVWYHLAGRVFLGRCQDCCRRSQTSTFCNTAFSPSDVSLLPQLTMPSAFLQKLQQNSAAMAGGGPPPGGAPPGYPPQGGQPLSGMSAHPSGGGGQYPQSGYPAGYPPGPSQGAPPQGGFGYPGAAPPNPPAGYPPGPSQGAPPQGGFGYPGAAPPNPFGQPPQAGQMGQQFQANAPYGQQPRTGPLGVPPQPGAGGPSPDMYYRLFEKWVNQRRLSSFYPPQRIQQLAAQVSRVPLSQLACEFRCTTEIAMDLVQLALYDIVILADDSGSMQMDSRAEELKVT